MLKNKVSGPKEEQAISTVDTPKKSPLEIVENIVGAVNIIKCCAENYKQQAELAKTMQQVGSFAQQTKQCQLRADHYMEAAIKLAQNTLEAVKTDNLAYGIMVMNQARQVVELAAEVASIAEETDKIARNAETTAEATQLKVDKLPIPQEQTEELEKFPSATKCTNTMS